MIFNYRVNFGGKEIDYHNNFQECKKYFPILKELYDLMLKMHVDYCWHFFEPYVEFTWVVDSRHTHYTEDILSFVLDILKNHDIEPTLVHRPEDGVVVDWYCKNPEEQEFGYRTYALSAKVAMLFWEYRNAIERGCGERNQFMRRPHVLANQIGMNYDDEGEALGMRSVLAGLFWEIGDHDKAVKMYEQMFPGEKYL